MSMQQDSNRNDPKLLTKSTLNNQESGDKRTHLPNLAGSDPNGYISDFYKNKALKQQSDKNQYASEGSNMMVQNVQSFDYPGGADVPTNGNPANKLNKISSKKFFQSKIDFAAPIKSLQHRGGTQDANLSDDSYIE